MKELSRRRVLAVGGMAIGALATTTAGAAATPGEQTNSKIVSDFCAAWPARDIDVLMPYLAENISYRITETTPPIVGRAAFHDRIKSILERLTSIEFKVVETLAKGPVVLNERNDTLVSPQRTQHYHCVGMFFLADGKIVEWTDYIITRS
jgi:limonene-1,2-epoxide hydrolase